MSQVPDAIKQWFVRMPLKVQRVQGRDGCFRVDGSSLTVDRIPTQRLSDLDVSQMWHMQPDTRVSNQCCDAMP